jgi:hypothetical protein
MFLLSKKFRFCKTNFGIPRALAQVGKQAKSVAGTLIDRFCLPGDHWGAFIV